MFRSPPLLLSIFTAYFSTSHRIQPSQLAVQGITIALHQYYLDVARDPARIVAASPMLERRQRPSACTLSSGS
jgi:hypothetical protein